MNESERKRAGAIALSLCLGGLVLAVILGSYMVFLGFQITGFFLGIVSRQEVFGKMACITSVALALGSILFRLCFYS
jgi:hypothetical protein